MDPTLRLEVAEAPVTPGPTSTRSPTIATGATTPASAAAALPVFAQSPLPTHLPPPASSPASVAPSLLVSPASRLSQLKAASDHWRAIDLDRQRGLIDAQALAVVDEEERAIAARKSLADQTKAFKKLDAADQVPRVGPVVKAYQEEINALTKRAKASETAYLALYKLLYDAPDPHVILSASLAELERLQTVEETLRTTSATLAEYELEFSGLKNQEVTVRKLEQENRELAMELDRRVEKAVADQLLDQQHEIEEVKRAFQVQEKLSQARVEALKEQLSAALSTQAQLQSVALSVDRRAEQAELRSGQEEALNEREVERLQAELAQRVREVADLRASQKERENSEDALQAAEVRRMEEEVAALQHQLQNADAAAHAQQMKVDQMAASAHQAQEASAAAEERHAAIVGALKAEIADLPAKAEYEELKRQMRFYTQELDGGGGEGGDPSQQDGGGAGRVGVDATGVQSALPSPEQLLLAKSRRLESELTRVKLAHGELAAKAEAMQKEVTSLREQVQAARQLNAKLEEDLVHANSHMVQGMVQQQQQQQQQQPHSLLNVHQTLPDDFLGPEPSANRPPLLASSVGGAASTASPADSSASATDPPSSATAPAFATSPAAATPAATIAQLQSQLQQSASMLTIVLQQRDRYRSKIDIIETQATLLTNQIDSLKLEKQVLKSDNLKLYEKLQYVKSMAGSGGGSAGASTTSDIESGWSESARNSNSSSSSGGGVGGKSSTGSSSSPDPESKYAAVYESRLNPFAEFKQRTRTAREQQLSTSERVTLAVGRALFSKKLARTIMFGYALVLHLLIGIVLWTHTVSSHCGTDLDGKPKAHKH